MASGLPEDVESFLSATAEFVSAHGLLARGEPVLAAVSGGADSLARAEALRRLAPGPVAVAHVHHGLRDQADADAEFVARWAGQAGLACHLQRIDTRALARQWHAGIEEAARRGRYRALAEVARSIGAPAVAVAHHADDQVETVLHRIVRGTHLRGLGGMGPARPLGPGVRLVRPLLWARRSRIERFCRDCGLQWRTDLTNRQTDFTRNFIRHDLLPLLRKRINVRADEAVLRLASAAREAEAALTDLAEDLFRRACRKRSAGEVVLRIAPLTKAPPLLASLALRRALAHLDAPERQLTQERYDDLLALLGGAAQAADLPGGVRAERRGRDLALTRPTDG